ncbi:MAG: Na+/H+ antiporter NhaC family protein [Pegethrix bostrychoides GSE-TBD4-15B]|jgi:NhaC family Na+:H+ antiporter|uniref:Na+/H+ antiporter NhaC family protein n=1 Tax=Pegethrix bostrychoides GSE-TBD4-15B TaxID=2839662 RepID=A0A951U5S7_9CYAN|nr:Na+/H+ antiporter NhaC family protein [Pegethrix bostrychoides GSE-TBD4-15B]
MNIGLALLGSVTVLLLCTITSVYIAYPLLLILLLFIGICLHKGFSIWALWQMCCRGSQKALPVFTILTLIGAVTATWMAAGTVPAIVYYGIQLIQPQWFILAAFLLTSLVSLLIGTSFGAASTIGLAMMIMAKGSSVNPDLIAGAVIAGAYLGEQRSPMSSSAHLVAAITQTDLYGNIKRMVQTGLWPLIVSCGIYLGLSLLYPMQARDQSLSIALQQLFELNAVVLLPAGVIIVLALLRVEAKYSMLLSIVAAIGLAVFYQQDSLEQVLQFAIFGFRLESDSPIQTILRGGGILPMLKVCGTVLISTSLAGILAGTGLLKTSFKRLVRADYLEQSPSTAQRFSNTALIGALAAAFGCTQTIGILLTEDLVQQNYKQSEQLALDLENTVVVLSPLIPWNIAGLVPATVLMTDWQFIPYACYLYLIPVLVWLQLRTLAQKPKGYCSGK